MFTVPDRAWSPVRLGLVLAAPALVLAACGSSSSGGTQGGSSTKATGASSHAATVETRNGPLGTFLSDGSGRTLYLFAADHASTSTCTSSCAVAWPPLTTKGTATASGGVKASLLGTTDRGGGVQQVTYAGHPLYYFAGDQGAGQTSGEGSTAFGAAWWVVSPSGSAITHGSGGAGSPTPSGGSYGNGSGGGGY